MRQADLYVGLRDLITTSILCLGSHAICTDQEFAFECLREDFPAFKASTRKREKKKKNRSGDVAVLER